MWSDDREGGIDIAKRTGPLLLFYRMNNFVSTWITDTTIHSRRNWHILIPSIQKGKKSFSYVSCMKEQSETTVPFGQIYIWSVFPWSSALRWIYDPRPFGERRHVTRSRFVWQILIPVREVDTHGDPHNAQGRLQQWRTRRFNFVDRTSHVVGSNEKGETATSRRWTNTTLDHLSNDPRPSQRITTPQVLPDLGGNRGTRKEDKYVSEHHP